MLATSIQPSYRENAALMPRAKFYLGPTREVIICVACTFSKHEDAGPRAAPYFGAVASPAERTTAQKREKIAIQTMR